MLRGVTAEENEGNLIRNNHIRLEETERDPCTLFIDLFSFS